MVVCIQNLLTLSPWNVRPTLLFAHLPQWWSLHPCLWQGEWGCLHVFPTALLWSHRVSLYWSYNIKVVEIGYAANSAQITNSLQMTNLSISTFKGELKFFRFKIGKYKTRAFNRKIEIKPIPILLNISLVANTESLLILLSVFRVGFDAQFHRLQ